MHVYILSLVLLLGRGGGWRAAAPGVDDVFVHSDRPVIRKLHLVRPDLLYYPLATEVYV